MIISELDLKGGVMVVALYEARSKKEEVRRIQKSGKTLLTGRFLWGSRLY
jgi:hypothetical protein